MYIYIYIQRLAVWEINASACSGALKHIATRFRRDASTGSRLTVFGHVHGDEVLGFIGLLNVFFSFFFLNKIHLPSIDKD